MREHEKIYNLLTDFVLGETSQGEATDIHAHLAHCPQCTEQVKRLRALLDCAGQMGKLSADTQMCELARQRVLAAVRAESMKHESLRAQRSPIWRIPMRSPITKLAAAAMIVLAVGLGIHFFRSTTTTPAFGKVVGPILSAQTVVYKALLRGKDQPVQTWEGMYMAPGLTRQIMRFGNDPNTQAIQIMDMQQGTMLTLIPAQKLAMIIELQNRPDQPQQGQVNLFEELRNRIRKAQENPDESVSYLGESSIDGHKVVGYRVNLEGMDFTIWADSESLLPLQIEVSLEKMTGQPDAATITDIQFDVPLNRADFSIEVPPGYTQQTMQIDASMPTEADLIEALRIWVEAAGKFPPELNMASSKDLIAAIEAKGSLKKLQMTDLNDPALQEFLKLFNKINRGYLFATSLPQEADKHYTGKDATVGDANTAIFWYRAHRDSQNYRVIYADLHVADVPAGNQPQ